MANPTELPADFARPRTEPTREPRRGGVSGLLLVLGGLTAAGFAVYDRFNRVEVVMTNPTAQTIRSVQLFRGTTSVELGPIGPGERRRLSFRLRGEGPIRGSVLVRRPMSPDACYNLELAEPWQAGDRLALTYDGFSVEAERKAGGGR